MEPVWYSRGELVVTAVFADGRSATWDRTPARGRYREPRNAALLQLIREARFAGLDVPDVAPVYDGEVGVPTYTVEELRAVQARTAASARLVPRATPRVDRWVNMSCPAGCGCGGCRYSPVYGTPTETALWWVADRPPGSVAKLCDALDPHGDTHAEFIRAGSCDTWVLPVTRRLLNPPRWAPLPADAPDALREAMTRGMAAEQVEYARKRASADDEHRAAMIAKCRAAGLLPPG